MSPWPSIFAGGARGGLTTGRYLNFDGEPHAKALVSIAQIMGRDINSVGDIDPDSSPLDGPRLSTRGAGRNVFAESCGWKKACRTEFARERARTTCRATLSCSSRHVSGKVREFGDIATYDATCVVFGFTTTAVLWLVLLPACSGSPADSSEASSGMSSDAGGSGPGTASATRAGESAANGTVGGSNAVSVGGAASDSASATAADSQANSMGGSVGLDAGSSVGGSYGARSNDWYWAVETNGSSAWGLNFDDGFTGFNSGAAAWNTFGPSWARCVR
jgi:hypothetical protein